MTNSTRIKANRNARRVVRLIANTAALQAVDGAFTEASARSRFRNAEEAFEGVNWSLVAELLNRRDVPRRSVKDTPRLFSGPPPVYYPPNPDWQRPQRMQKLDAFHAILDAAEAW